MVLTGVARAREGVREPGVLADLRVFQRRLVGGAGGGLFERDRLPVQVLLPSVKGTISKSFNDFFLKMAQAKARIWP